MKYRKYIGFIYFSGKNLTDDIIFNLLGDGNDSDIEDILDENFLVEDNEAEYAEDLSTTESFIVPEPPKPPEPVPSENTSSQADSGHSTQRVGSSRGQSRGKIWRQTNYPDKVHNYQPLPLNAIRTPIQYFEDYFNDEFYELGAVCTNNYHLRKTGKVLKTSADEIKKLFGMHVYMGVFAFPRLYLFWRQNTRLALIADVMTRDRFTTLRSALHFVPEDQPTSPEDRLNPLWKVQPVIDKVKQTCCKLERVPCSYSIDEQMIPFTGRCSLRQVVRNKPRPVGLKNFVLTTSEGLMLDFEIYLGARTAFAERDLGVGASVILHLAQKVPVNSCLYFDRFFTSVSLLERLTELGLHGTGTIMMNRVRERKNLNFKADNKMKRGESQQFVCDDDLALVKWKDNKSVMMISNCTGADNTSLIKRWDKPTKTYVDVTCPKVISNYNRYMGGVDVLDQQIEYYRAFIKTKKWTLKVIIHFLDLAVANAWRLYRNDCIANNVPQNRILDLLHFRLDVAEGLTETPTKGHLQPEENDEIDVGVLAVKKYKQPTPSVAKRHDNFGHLPYFDDNITSPRVCKLEVCNSRSKIMCTKCKVYLCLSRGKNCFSEYHTVH